MIKSISSIPSHSATFEVEIQKGTIPVHLDLIPDLCNKVV